jgi:hypothetical protein
MSGSLDSFFARQLAIYASYHRDHRNRATHFIGIPAIVFSILVPLALVKIDGISLALMVAIFAVLGWVALDRVIGLAMLIMMDRVRHLLCRRLGVSTRRPRLGRAPSGAGGQSVSSLYRSDVHHGRSADGAGPQAGAESRY